MISALKFGSFLLTHAWVLPVVVLLLLAIGVFTYGRAVLDILRGILDFFRSPVGQVAIILIVLYFASSAGYQLAESECGAEKLRTELAAETAKRKLLDDQVKAGDAIAARDADRASWAEAENTRLQELINATPNNSSACLSADDVRRVYDIRPGASRPGRAGAAGRPR